MLNSIYKHKLVAFALAFFFRVIVITWKRYQTVALIRISLQL